MEETVFNTNHYELGIDSKQVYLKFTIHHTKHPPTEAISYILVIAVKMKLWK